MPCSCNNDRSSHKCKPQKSMPQSDHTKTQSTSPSVYIYADTAGQVYCGGHKCNVQSGGVQSEKRTIVDYTDPTLSNSIYIKNIHLIELGIVLNYELSARGFANEDFSGRNQEYFSSKHFIQIRDAINKCRQNDITKKRKGATSAFNWESNTYKSGDIITTSNVQTFRNFIAQLQGTCMCQCNYDCSCNNNTCTCYCNYCNCQCNWWCPCDCNYGSDKRLKENIEYF